MTNDYEIDKMNIRLLANTDPRVVDVLVNHHYLKRKPAAKYSYGLFYEDTFVGVATYGLPSRPVMQKWNNEILELVRLYTFDNYKHLPLSRFLTMTLKDLKQTDYKMVISYAQLNANHSGAIYQATSWIYVGLSSKANDFTIRGLEKVHPKTIRQGITLKELKAIIEPMGIDWYNQPRPRKAKYFFPLIKRKKALKIMNEMNYEILDKYPKLKDKDIQEQIEADQVAKANQDNYDVVMYDRIKEKVRSYRQEVKDLWGE